MKLYNSKFFSTLFLITIISASYAQTPYQVKDIYSGVNTGVSSNYYPFNYNGILLFEGITANEGYELWRTDGTTAGTYMVKDINPGSDDSYPSGFFQFNGIVYFSARTANEGTELWRTDGTSGGTYLVKDIAPGTNNSISGFYTFWQHNGFFYFTAYSTYIDNNEIWKSDGTTAGTTQLKDINPGTGSSYADGFYEFNNQLYFTATEPTTGRELWKTDGTTAGTAMVKDICTGTNNSFGTFSVFWQHNGFFYFNAFSSYIDDYEIWKSDGTAAGTTQLKDINPGTGSSYADDFYEFNNQLYFSATEPTHGRELWKTDGTTAGTALVKDICPGIETSVAPFEVFWQHNGYFYFNAFSSYISDYEIWKSDGTTAGTTQLKDINPGAGDSYTNGFYEFNNQLYFSATEPTNGRELWKTDGTTAGTSLVKDICPGVNGSIAPLEVFWQHNGYFYFNAFSSYISDYEIWKSDGTTAGTTQLKDINPGAGDSYADGFFTFNNQLYFSAVTPATGRELWKTDGTTGGTSLIKDINTGPNGGISSLKYFDYNGYFYFEGSSTLGDYELWKSDGTTANTNLVADIYAGTSGSSPDNFYALNNTYMLFTARDAATGRELWAFNMPGISSSTPEIENNTEIKVYPNPAHQYVSIFSSEKNMNVSVRDITSKFIAQFTSTENNYKLDVSNFKPGMYFFTIANGKSTTTRKIIVE